MEERALPSSSQQRTQVIGASLRPFTIGSLNTHIFTGYEENASVYIIPIRQTVEEELLEQAQNILKEVDEPQGTENRHITELTQQITSASDLYSLAPSSKLPDRERRSPCLRDWC